MTQPITFVNLISCRSAQGAVRSNVSTGQVLADFLGAPVKAYRKTVTRFNAHAVSDLAGNPAGMKVFHSRLKDFDAAHPHPQARQVAEREALVRQVEEDRRHHMFWHNVSAKFGRILSTVNSGLNALREPRSVGGSSGATAVDALFRDIARFALDVISFQTLLERNNVQLTEESRQLLAPIEEFRESAVDADDCLGICLEVLSLSPEWLRMAGEPP
jgi:hypothetical protein